MAIDWKRVRDDLVPPVAEDDPALARIYAQLRWLEKHVTPEGNDPLTGRPWTELRAEFQQSLHDDIESYRWQKAGFIPTREILDACRDKDISE
jgi:hypothetical protein